MHIAKFLLIPVFLFSALLSGQENALKISSTIVDEVMHNKKSCLKIKHVLYKIDPTGVRIVKAESFSFIGCSAEEIKSAQVNGERLNTSSSDNCSSGYIDGVLFGSLSTMESSHICFIEAIEGSDILKSQLFAQRTALVQYFKLSH